MTDEDRKDRNAEESPEVYGVQKGLEGWKFGRREFMTAAAAAAAAATVGGMAAMDKSKETVSEMVELAGESFPLTVAMLAMVAVEPGQAFTQVWEFTNSSESAPFKGASLYLLDGNPMKGPMSIAVPEIAPGKTVAVRADLVAPAEPGTYQNTWRLQPAEEMAPVSFSPFVLQNGCIIESPHPYGNATVESYQVVNPDESALTTRVHFTRVELDTGDTITLKDSMDREQQRISGSYPDGLWSERIPGRVVKVELVTNLDGTAWGFCLDRIESSGRIYFPFLLKEPSPTPTATPTRTPTPTATSCSCHGYCSCNPHCICDRICTCDTIHYWYPN